VCSYKVCSSHIYASIHAGHAKEKWTKETKAKDWEWEGEKDIDRQTHR